VRDRDWIRNSLIGLVVFVLATAGRLYAGLYWSKAFLLDRTFESRWALDPTLLVAIWGWDFLVALVAGFIFFLLVKGKRPLLWVTALGLGFALFKLRFSHHWISPEADWTVYVEDYGAYVVPVIAALAGGYLANVARTIQHFRRGA